MYHLIQQRDEKCLYLSTNPCTLLQSRATGEGNKNLGWIEFAQSWLSLMVCLQSTVWQWLSASNPFVTGNQMANTKF